MNTFMKLPAGLLFVLVLISTNLNASTVQDIRVYTADNKHGNITAASIEKAFENAGFVIDADNDMNKPFSKRFGGTHYPLYRLATVHHSDITARLIRVNPQFALLTPLSMSIWQEKSGQINIASLSLRGMSRISAIPQNNPDLVTLAKRMEKALRSALPGGHFKKLPYRHVAAMDKPLAVTLTAAIERDEETELSDWKDDFESEFEGEMEPIGFLFPGFIDLNDELIDHGDNRFDFFDTYSVCKLDVIYPVSKTHPEVGAFAPCTFYLYKLKKENVMHMGFPSVQNWIASANIKDKASLAPLLEAEKLFVDTLKSITE